MIKLSNLESPLQRTSYRKQFNVNPFLCKLPGVTNCLKFPLISLLKWVIFCCKQKHSNMVLGWLAIFDLLTENPHDFVQRNLFK